MEFPPAINISGFLKGRFVRALRLGSDSSQVAPGSATPIYQRSMLRYSVVPNNNCAFLPHCTDVEVNAIRNMFEKKFEQCVRFFLLKAHNLASN